nr:hypothetical protein [Tanacetum cinerariifolium]
KTGLGYDGQMNESDLNDVHVNESEVLNNVFDSRESNGDNSQVNDMFKKESDSEDENVFEPKEVKKTVKPSLENIKFINAKNTTVENENKAKKPRKFSQSPRAAVLTKSGQVPDNAAKQSSHREAALVSVARHTYDWEQVLPHRFSRNNGGFVSFRGNAKGGKITGKEGKATQSLLREFSVARTPQQNGVAEKKNRTLIETARTMLTDSKLPTTFWAEAVNTACYVQIGYEVYDDAGKKSIEVPRKENGVQDPAKESDKNKQEFERLFGQGEIQEENKQKRNEFESVFRQDKDVNGNRMLTPIRTTGSTYVNLGRLIHDNRIFSGAYNDEVEGAIADFNSLELTTVVSHIPTIRIYEDHSKKQIIRDPLLAPQTRRMTKTSQEHAMVSYIKKQKRTNHKDYQNCLLACFLLQKEPKKVIQALTDPSWIEAMQNELLQFRLQKDKDDILLVKVYVDDIIFGSTKKSLCTEFEGLMHKKFQMSSIGELTFFLGLQVMQRDDRIFIIQDKYVANILKKFNFSSVKTASTPIETNKALFKDEKAKDVDVYLYRSMIGSLMYLTASRPDIMFAVCACTRFQVPSKVSHLHAVKRIFRYLKGQPKLGLWYPRDSPSDLNAFSDSDYARASLDRISTTGGCQFLRKRLISLQCKKQTVVANSTTETEYVAAANCCGQFWQTATTRKLDNGEMEITATIDGKVKVVTEASVRRHLKLEDYDGISILPTIEIFEQLELMGNIKRDSKGYTEVDIPLFPAMIVQGLIFQGEGSAVPVESHHIPTDKAASTGVDVIHKGAATTVTSLDVGQGSGNIDKTPSMPHDSPLPRVKTLGSDEGKMQHNEFMDLVTKLSDGVLALKTYLKQTKKVYGDAYTKLIMKVKKLEKTIKKSQARIKTKIVVSDEEVDLEDPSKQGKKIEEIDQDPDISLIQHDANIQGRYEQDMEFDFNAAKEVSTAEQVSTAGAAVTTASVDISPTSPIRVSTTDDITMVETLAFIKRSAAKTKDKGKGIMEESESAMTKTKIKQEQERLGHEAAVRLQEEFDEKDRQRIAKRLQAEEMDKYSEVDQAKMLVDLIDQRKKYFAAKRAKEKRNKPMTQTQQKTYMSNYIKHMGSHTPQQLRRLSFDEIKELFKATMKRVNTFIPMETERTSELAAGSSKRVAEEALNQGSSKRQKTNEASGSVQE